MTRILDPVTEAALGDTVVFPAILLEAAFASGQVNLWTGYGEIVWNGLAWTGLGHLIGVSAVTETDEITAEGFIVTLSGVPLEFVQLSIEEARQGLPGRAWLALLDGDGSIVGAPVQFFEGELDVPTIEDGADSVAISISYEGKWVDLLRPSSLRWTHESQQTLYPGDLGFEYVASIQDAEVTWGRTS